MNCFEALHNKLAGKDMVCFAGNVKLRCEWCCYQLCVNEFWLDIGWQYKELLACRSGWISLVVCYLLNSRHVVVRLRAFGTPEIRPIKSVMTGMPLVDSTP